MRRTRLAHYHPDKLRQRGILAANTVESPRRALCCRSGASLPAARRRLVPAHVRCGRCTSPCTRHAVQRLALPVADTGRAPEARRRAAPAPRHVDHDAVTSPRCDDRRNPLSSVRPPLPARYAGSDRRPPPPWRTRSTRCPSSTRPCRPHHYLATALIQLRRPEEAAVHALAAYRQACGDAPPFCQHCYLAHASRLLNRLYLPPPHLPTLDLSASRHRSNPRSACSSPARDAGQR